MTGPWLAYTICGAFAVILASIWVKFAAGLARAARSVLYPRAVAEFARANGWSYQARGWHPFDPGPPYWNRSSAGCTHLVSGTYRGHDFVAFVFAHEAQVVTLKLPMSLPLVEIRPQGLAGQAQLAVPSVTLESEAFDRRFQIHADDAKFASDILHPRLMEDLLLAPPLCWRIWRDDLVGWWPGEPAPARILTYLAVLNTIKDAIPAFVWHDYGLTDTTTG